MTLVFRDGRGRTQTFYQHESRVRIENWNWEDDGEARIIDFKTTENVIVYDDVKAYFDMNKAFAAMRRIVDRLPKAQKRLSARSAVSDRALGETRRINGFSCEMHQSVRAGRVEDEICFAPWGGTLGTKADFAWLEALAARASEDVGLSEWASRVRANARHDSPGLSIWESSIQKDGSREVVEIVKVSHDVPPAALFQVPADYKEISRPLSASEHQPGISPPRVEDVAPQGASRLSSSDRRRISGLLLVILVVGVAFGVAVHAFILHLAANVVVANPRIMQAVIAAVVISGVATVAEVFKFPTVLSVPVGMFGSFAALKGSYGASVPRTLALMFVSGVIVLLTALALHGIRA